MGMQRATTSKRDAPSSLQGLAALSAFARSARDRDLDRAALDVDAPRPPATRFAFGSLSIFPPERARPARDAAALRDAEGPREADALHDAEPFRIGNDRGSLRRFGAPPPDAPGEPRAARDRLGILALGAGARPPFAKPKLSASAPMLLRAARSDTAPVTSEAPAAAAEPPAPASAAAPAQRIVDDDASTVAAGQMRKTEFLTVLRAAVCQTAEAALAQVGRSAQGCPWIERWFAYYAGRSAAQVERAIARFVPGSAGVGSARGLIPGITERVREGIAAWARTGEIPEIPGEAELAADGATASAGAPAAASGAPAAAGSDSGADFALARKARDGASSTVAPPVASASGASPGAVRAQLGRGQPLDAGVQSRMSAAFGESFSDVRVHLGGQAASLSDQLDARAFTVGRDVVFGRGEYAPSTPEGDALIAHELAHVVQQRGGSEAPAPKANAPESSALEADADQAAVSAVVALWGRAVGAASRFARNAIPRLKSGLGLSRCTRCQKTPAIVKRLTVHRLAGAPLSDAAIRSDVTAASQIWMDGAGIQLSPTFHPSIDEARTRALIGTESGEATRPVSELQVDADTSGVRDTTETNNLAALAAGHATAVYVPRVIFGGLTFPPTRMVFIQETCRPGFTLAHELGHLFLGGGHSRCWDSALMQHPENCGSTSIDDDDCRVAREVPGAAMEQRRNHPRC